MKIIPDPVNQRAASIEFEISKSFDHPNVVRSLHKFACSSVLLIILI